LSRRTLRVYVVRDQSGLLTGRLVARSNTRAEYVATGASEEELFARLQEQLSAQPDPVQACEPFSWSEALHVDKVLVEVRPQVALGKRTVIGKQRIPLELSYAWAALVGEERQGTPAGFRVMLPRFGFWFVLEDLRMAAEVLRQAVSATLAGEAARSLFEYREAAHEYVLEWAPRWRKSRRSDGDESEEFKVLRSVAEEWGELGRAGKLGSHFGPVDEQRYGKLLAASQKPSLLLVGPSGVGKTEWVSELGRRAGRFREGGAAVRVWSSSADRIMAGQTYLGMWEQRCLELLAELRGEGHFLFLDRLAELVRPRSGASSIADLLLSAIADGSISVIAECTGEEYEKLQASHASLLACFELVRLEEPSTEQVCALIAEHQARSRPGVELTPDAIRRLVRHLGLFQKSSAFPGKAWAFLNWLTKAGPAVLSTDTANAREADRLFAKFSGLAERLVSDSERASTRDIGAVLQQRVVGQDAACESAARVLARFKAGVNDPEKPLGSLLFVGPTGVGKTELAKELSRFLFGGHERLVRIDMSELLLPSSVGRLLSDERGAASLAQRVSQEPLSVVLLDEIEKAHPAVFDVLLGLLGEGRLTTSSGRLVDFRMTLVIMTSNLGSSVTRAGFGALQADPKALHSAVRAHFRPEFFNRMDQVVTFSPLSEGALLRIVDLSLAALAEREGLRRRNLRLAVSDGAKAELARLGSDAEYGARPLKRVIEERIVMPLSVELSRKPTIHDVTARVGVVGGELVVELER
jgi:ATP-dependent Clp protease ATP-binding subunit ClpC